MAEKNGKPEFDQPKIELHVHLDGAIRIKTIIEVAKRRGINLPASSEDEMRNLCIMHEPGTLTEFLGKFNHYMHVIANMHGSTSVPKKGAMVTSTALHQNGLTCKEIATKNIAHERTIYRIIKNFKERGLTAVRKSSGRPRVSSKRQDCLLLRSQLQNRVTSNAELAQEWQQVAVRASARTVRPRLLDNGLVSRRAAKKPLLSKKHIKD